MQEGLLGCFPLLFFFFFLPENTSFMNVNSWRELNFKKSKKKKMLEATRTNFMRKMEKGFAALPYTSSSG